MGKDNTKKGQKFYVVPQTEEDVERNRKIIEEMRLKGLLQKYEKTFQIQKDGTVVEIKENNKKIKKLKEKSKIRNWSKYVTEHSFSLGLEKGVFTWSDPKKIALSLKQSAEESLRRKAEPFQSAISMLNFYINRAGKNLNPKQRKVLEQAKRELRALFKK